MGRWGEEESKTKGIGGCLIALLVLAGVIFGFVKAYPIIEGRKQLEEEVQTICRTAHGKTEIMVRSAIMAKARDLDIPIKEEDISVTKTKDTNQNQVLLVRLSYVHTADFGLFTKDFPVSISERVVLIRF